MATHGTPKNRASSTKKPAKPSGAAKAHRPARPALAKASKAAKPAPKTSGKPLATKADPKKAAKVAAPAPKPSGKSAEPPKVDGKARPAKLEAAPVVDTRPTKAPKAAAGAFDLVIPDTTRSRPARRRGDASGGATSSGQRNASSGGAPKKQGEKLVAEQQPVVRAPARPMGERKEMKRLVLRGKDRGFVTFDDINESLPPDVTTLGGLEDCVALLAENEVEVVDDALKFVNDAAASAPVNGQPADSAHAPEAP